MARQGAHARTERMVETDARGHPSAREIALEKIGVAVIGVFQTGMLEHSAHEVRAIKARTHEVRPNKAGLTRIDPAEVGLAKRAFAEI